MHTNVIILLTKITAAQNAANITYHRVCGLHFLVAIFCDGYRDIDTERQEKKSTEKNEKF